MKRLLLLPAAVLLLTACGHDNNAGTAAVSTAPGACSSDIQDSYAALRSHFDAVHSRADAFRCQEEMNAFLAANQGINCNLEVGTGWERRPHMRGVLNRARLDRLMTDLNASYQIVEVQAGPGPEHRGLGGDRHDFHRQ